MRPGTATAEFFICIGDQRLDFGGRRNPAAGAAFGQVVQGMAWCIDAARQGPPSNGKAPIAIGPVRRT